MAEEITGSRCQPARGPGLSSTSQSPWEVNGFFEAFEFPGGFPGAGVNEPEDP